MPFRDVVGHLRIRELLQRAIDRGSLPPTLLLAGPAGVGKWRLATAVAQALNCLSPSHGDACGACRSCDRIARSMHVDVLALEPDETGSIKIDPVRAVLEACAYRPFEGRRRAVLVRDADAMRVEAQNALLKSLEEPPPGTVFVLTSAAPDALLRTVRSRTMRLVCGRLGADDITTILAGLDGRSAAAARAAALLADGSAGAALAVGSSDLIDLRQAAQSLLLAASAPDMAGRLAAAKSVIGTKPERTRQGLDSVLRIASSLARDLALMHAGADRDLLANADAADVVERLARALPPEAARRAFATIDRAREALDRNAGTKVVAEWMVAEL